MSRRVAFYGTLRGEFPMQRRLGVDGMLRFWLGEFGYEAFLQRVREEQP